MGLIDTTRMRPGVYVEIDGNPHVVISYQHVNPGKGGAFVRMRFKNLTSGSVLEDDTIGLCVRELGHKRVLFATDLTMEGGVGKILSAELTPEQRENIFWRNFQGILSRRAT